MTNAEYLKSMGITLSDKSVALYANMSLTALHARNFLYQQRVREDVEYVVAEMTKRGLPVTPESARRYFQQNYHA